MPNEIYNNQVADLPLWSDEEAFSVLLKICEENKIPVDVLTELVILQRERQHQERAAGVYLRIEEILGRVD
jgi:hypothetical protein